MKIDNYTFLLTKSLLFLQRNQIGETFIPPEREILLHVLMETHSVCLITTYKYLCEFSHISIWA